LKGELPSMTRYQMTQDQVASLTDIQARDLLQEVQNHLQELADLEWKLYKRKRERDLEDHPELATIVRPPTRKAVPKSTDLVDRILKLAEAKGIDLEQFIK